MSAEDTVKIILAALVSIPGIVFLFLTVRSNMENAKLKNTLKVQRAKKDLTQEQLADIVSVTRKTVNTIVKGRFVPSTVLALKLARALDVTVEELFFLDDE